MTADRSPGHIVAASNNSAGHFLGRTSFDSFSDTSMNPGTKNTDWLQESLKAARENGLLLDERLTYFSWLRPVCVRSEEQLVVAGAVLPALRPSFGSGPTRGMHQ
ncbi:hypothetical protein E2C01_080749 [Portunus trituberculatus]|uniref:Uncharacterized protein n=1 Tax=Portunus trituberculatus TaxID=210409 RepID=A0A5B7IU79_PORTR|nr:hypothetical protein [Portunus trituberculatus]